MRVTVAIPTLDRPQYVAALARAMLVQTWPDMEVLILDQSDNLELRDLLAPGVQWVHLPVKSLPNARNVAAGMATGQVVLYLDDDMQVPAELVERHARHYRDPSVGAVGGRILGAYERAGDGRVGYLRWDGRVVRNFGSAQAATPQFLPGGNVSVRRELILAHGGFDLRFGGTAVGEETDFFLRLRARGVRFVFDPEACVEHLPVPTGGCRDPDPRTWTYWMMHNVTLLWLRHLPWWSLPVALVNRLARAVLLEVRGRKAGLLGRALAGMLHGASSFVRSGGRRHG